MQSLTVIKRDGSKVPVSFDEITKRIRELSQGLSHVNPDIVSQKVCSQLEDGISTSKLDEFAAEVAATMQSRYHPNYGYLASRILISNYHKQTSNLNYCFDIPTISEKHKELITKYFNMYESMIDYSRDYLFDYFGFQTLKKSYLLKNERPQHLWMRVAIQLHENNFEKVRETYDALSLGYFIHATPTLFNSGTEKPQLSSCFLLKMKDDSIKGIYETLSDCAEISKWSGGIGLNIHNIRGRGSKIHGTQGISTGIVPMLKVYNNTANYVNQGGKRNGSFAIYLEPWHTDIEDFLRLKLNQGIEEERARDLFYALWIPDLFMKRVENDSYWTLMCPSECSGLSDVYGSDFEEIYTKYEFEGKGRRVQASDIWKLIMDSQIQTGMPYLCYKDSANSKSNQQNLGVIKSSNLCAEILEYSSSEETAVCNLGSLALPKFIIDGVFQYDLLRKYTKILARNLDILIDKNYYPTTECSKSNFKNRPIGIGVQGLADTFAILKISWLSEEARKLNKEIFEHIYYASIEASIERAQELIEYQHLGYGQLGSYASFEGSPISKGKLQFDLWNVKPITSLDWNSLRERASKGIRNSLSVALMPTASTSQILGNNECFEPFTSNIYTRRVLAGEFIVINKYLVKDLVERNMWTSDIRTKIIANNGSIQSLTEIPSELKSIYKTVWEIPQKCLLDLSGDRAPFICQSQSLNLFVNEPSYAKLTSMHFYAWKLGLKTGCYYLRTKGVAKAQQFTIEPCLTCSS
jgi:ribonucleoside-diphosphate reductase alpha subunit